MLKVEGIAFRFLPDPVQIKNALEVSVLNILLELLVSLCHDHLSLSFILDAMFLELTEQAYKVVLLNFRTRKINNSR